MSEPIPIVFVDDEPELREANAQSLRLAGYRPLVFASAEEALAELSSDFPGVVVSDIRMPGLDGIGFFRRLKALDADLPVVLVTGHGDVEMAVSAVREGVYDFLPKPFTRERLTGTLARAAEKRALVLENRRLRALASGEGVTLTLIGDAPPMVHLRKTVAQIARAAVDVLVEGETGSGKEVVARLVHDMSGRSGPFVALNCGALPDTVMESELFGHERGAFTGAERKRVGRIAHSSKGTLFLDELESMPPALQVKLLRVLETREVSPLGSNAQEAVDLRVVAAVKGDLPAMIARGAFREDLYWRLNVVSLRIPPLRERRGDVPLLFSHFTRGAAARFALPVPDLSHSVRRRLTTHDWPGNVRELLHFAERVVLGLEPADDEEGAPGETDWTVGEAGAGEGEGLAAAVSAFEARTLAAVLAETRGDVRTALERLQLPRKTFYDKVKRHGLDLDAFR